MIIVQLTGGLGNQMFQYAMAKRISIINKIPLKIDVSYFETYELHSYGLNNLSIQENFAAKAEARKLKGPNFFKWINRCFKINLGNVYKEKHNNFDPHVLLIEDNTYLIGYWQSEKYFKDIEEIIKEDFTVKHKLDGRSKEMAEQIINTNSVSLHIRRGDYVNNKAANETHGTCDLNYYSKCIEFLGARFEHLHFYVFSDDIPWAQQSMLIPYPTTYVDFNGSDRNYEDLRLMSLCHHNIIANSTFSWWGAWLNKNPDKMVFAPKKWFNSSSLNSEDLLPVSWIKV